MPQRKPRTESNKMTMLNATLPTISRIELAKSEIAKRALPFFGGEDPDDDTTSTGEQNNNTTQQQNNSPGGDGNAGTATPELTPEQIAELVAKNLELDKQVKDQGKKLEVYTKAEQEEADKKLTAEQKAQKDIQERDQTIQQMDKVIRTLAVENAIAQSKDLKFHSAKHVINELDPSEYEIDVDLKTGQATISNLDKALKRIAEANPWMVVNAANDNPGNGNQQRRNNQNPGGAPRGSGNPPNPGNSRSSDATQRRADLIKKFPVLAARGAKA